MDGPDGPGFGRPRIKRHLKSVAKGQFNWTYWADEDYEEPFIINSQSWDHKEAGHSQAGLKELDAIVGEGHNFQTVKPLRLFQKLIQIWCPPEGLVMDPFAGSGTTGHAVLSVNRLTNAHRRFVLIEQGRLEKDDRFARTLTADRLKRVINGDWVSGKQAPLGAGYCFSALTRKVDAKAVLAMEREEMIDLLLSSHWDKDERQRPALVKFVNDGFKHLIACDRNKCGYFLIWRGSDDEATLDVQAYDEIVKEAMRASLVPPFNVYARYEDYQSNDVRFFKIPDRVLVHLGINEARDPFNDEESVDAAA